MIGWNRFRGRQSWPEKGSTASSPSHAKLPLVLWSVVDYLLILSFTVGQSTTGTWRVLCWCRDGTQATSSHLSVVLVITSLCGGTGETKRNSTYSNPFRIGFRIIPSAAVFPALRDFIVSKSSPKPSSFQGISKWTSWHPAWSNSGD